MDRFCFPIVVNTKKNKTEDYANYTGDDGVTYIDIKALQDLKDSQKLINLSVIDTDKLVSWISDLHHMACYIRFLIMDICYCYVISIPSQILCWLHCIPHNHISLRMFHCPRIFLP